MIIYSGTLKQFKQDVYLNKLTENLTSLFLSMGLGNTPEAEKRSWENSLQKMTNVMNLTSVDPEAHVAIEYKIPHSQKRVDFIVSGLDENRNFSAVIVELKQWQEAQATMEPDLVKTYLGGCIRSHTHPSYQAYSYARTIENFNEDVLTYKIRLKPCAYLHNMNRRNGKGILDERYSEVLREAPSFLMDDAKALAEYIDRYVKKSDGGFVLNAIENGRLKPSKSLQDCIGSMLEGNESFVLLDEQKVAFEYISKAIFEVKKGRGKSTIIVKGGPGTGKSVIAINLLADCIRKGLACAYTSKTSAPRNVYSRELQKGHGLKRSYISSLFMGSGCFVDAGNNTFDVLLADEAHRLNKKSGIYQTKGENQIQEIIHASRVSVFFIDERQKVTNSDFGSIVEIRASALREGSRVLEGEDFELVSQFRCIGSESFLRFVEDLLNGQRSKVYDPLDFDLKIYDDPSLMREDLRKLNTNNKTRMVAGYCYNWISKHDPTAFDIQIGDFKAQWNFSSTTTWAIDPESFDQVGCIHTSQGLEFDHVGVIMGEDIRMEDDGHVVFDYEKRAKSDQSLKGIKKSKNFGLAQEIIRNTYMTLLTRGMKGCYIYIQDERLRDFAKKLLAHYENPRHLKV